MIGACGTSGFGSTTSTLTAHQKWWAFDPDRGVPEGWLEVPADLEVHEIGEDHVLAVGRDFTGLPFVRRYLLDLSE